MPLCICVHVCMWQCVCVLYNCHLLYIPYRHDTSVRHYHIKQQENGEYFISEKHSFPSIKELVEYHKLNGGGQLYLCAWGGGMCAWGGGDVCLEMRGRVPGDEGTCAWG